MRGILKWVGSGDLEINLQDLEAIAAESGVETLSCDLGVNDESASRFILLLARQLQLNPTRAMSNPGSELSIE